VSVFENLVARFLRKTAMTQLMFVRPAGGLVSDVPISRIALPPFLERWLEFDQIVFSIAEEVCRKRGLPIGWWAKNDTRDVLADSGSTVTDIELAVQRRVDARFPNQAGDVARSAPRKHLTGALTQWITNLPIP